jgi:hypothetical protein
MNWTHFALHLSYELQRMAINHHAREREDYLYWAGSNREAEDHAFDSMEAAAALVDQAYDAVVFCENALFDSRKKAEAA